MKRILIVSVPFLLALFFVGCQYSGEEKSEAKTSPQAGELQTVTFKVDGMYCGACASKVKGAVLAVNGVTSCTVDYGKKVAICTFDNTKTTANQLTQATKGTPFTLTAVGSSS